MSTPGEHTQDIGQALLAEQQRYLQLIEQGACRADVSHALLLDIRGALQVQRLQQALDSLAPRHPLLHSRFVAVPGYHGLRQVQECAAQAVALTVHADIQPASVIEQRFRAWQQRPASLADAGLEVCVQQIKQDHWQMRLDLAGYLGDVGSLNLLADDLFAAYQQGVLAAKEEPGHFTQYLDWRSEVLFDEDAEAARTYWQQHVLPHGMVPAAPDLPYRTDDGLATETRMVSLALQPALSTRVGQLALQRAVPVEHVLQAAWWILLARISGREGFAVGWRHDARRDYEFFATSTGLFEKTLPLVLNVTPQHRFSQWLSGLSTTLEQHGTWQEYWSAQAYPELAAPACGFACRSAWQTREHGGLSWTAQPVSQGIPSFELILNAALSDEGQVQNLTLEYAAQRYSLLAAQMLLEQYQTLLQSIVANADSPIGELNLLSETERARLLAFNPPPTVLQEPWLPQRIAGWADSTPHALALVDGDTSLTYAELERQVSALAASIAERGVTAGSIVGLALPRSASLVVALLACWRLGAAYVPLDPQWPVARRAQVLEQAGAALLLTDHRAPADDAAEPVLVLDVFQAIDHGAGLVPVAAHCSQGSDVAYLLFTSGSTGVPKGVVIEQRHVLGYIASATQTLGLQACREHAFSSTVAADLGNTTLFGALFNGATLHVADDQTLQDPQAFARFIREQGIDCLKIVPSHLAALLDAAQPALPDTLILGGEAPASGLLQRITQINPGTRVFNHYGPTETTVGVLVHALVPGQGGAVPLTQVLPGNQVYLLDERLQLVAPGELGELYIGGRQLCRGYLNAGREAFVDSPFQLGECLYRTGDLGRYRLQGGLQLHGRRDEQIKIRGFRIELTEIENQLGSLPGVGEAVVVMHQTGRLQAFVVAQQAVAEDWTAQLKAGLSLRLPAVMQPNAIQVLQSMPRLANGKVDRPALRLYQMAERLESYVAPRDALEQLLAARMAQLLDIPRLSVTQDFFAAGGHSLLVIKLVAGIGKLLQCEVHPGVVFDHPSAAALAQVLRDQESLPGQLEKLASARLRLDAMTPQQKAALLEKARAQ